MYLIIDGNALLYRAYYATERWMRKRQINAAVQTNGVFVAMKMLKKLLSSEQGNGAYTRVFVTFDLGKATFRHQTYQPYKATRTKTPEPLIQQIPLFKKFLRALNITIFEDQHYEADDLIASLTTTILATNPHYNVDLLSGDRDLLQLVQSRVRLLFFQTGISKIKVVDEENFYRLFQIHPQQVVDYKALVGDQTDNLPGIKGIGPKTAQTLLQRFSSLEAIFAAKETFSGKLQMLLIEPKLVKQVQEVKQLAQLRTDLTLNPMLEETKIDFNNRKIQTLFAKYNMKSLMTKPDANQQKFAF